MPHHHDHHDVHGHDSNHARTSSSDERTLVIGVSITLLMALAEAWAGWISGSLALLSDAGHMVSDATALALATVAAKLARRPPSPRHSYGLGRAEVVAATLNAVLMLFIVGNIAVSAVDRFAEPEPIAGATATLVALLGLSVNAILAWLLHRRANTSLNLRAAFLHVLADLLGSVAALVSGLVVWFTGWVTIDPLLSLIICTLILWSAWHLLREGILVIMEGVPRHLNLTEVGQAIARTPRVTSVHDLHIWTLSSGSIALSAHLVIRDLRQWHEVLRAVTEMLHHRFGIDHITLQPECPTYVVLSPKIPSEPHR